MCTYMTHECMHTKICVHTHTHTHTHTLDTEGSFIVERVVDIANAAIQHLLGIADTSGDPGTYL